MKYLVSILFILVFSCNPLRHYQAVATDTEVTPKKLATIAPFVALNFPPEPPKYIRGKDSIVTVTTVDSSQINTLLNNLAHYKSLDSLNRDSLKNELLKICKSTNTVEYRTRIDTVEKSSSADKAIISTLQRQLAVASTKDAENETKITSLEESNKNKSLRNRNLIIALCISIAVNLFLGYLLIKPKFM